MTMKASNPSRGKWGQEGKECQGGLLLCREFEESLFHNCNETEQRKRSKKASRVENMPHLYERIKIILLIILNECLQADGKGREKNGIRGLQRCPEIEGACCSY